MVIHALSSATNRFNRGVPWLIAAAMSVAALGACSGADSESDGDPDAAAETSTTESEATATTDSPTTATSDATSTSPTETDADGGDTESLERLQEIIDATVARNSARFSLEVVQTLPVTGPNQTSMRRTGSFDDDQQQGSGTQQFLGEPGLATDLPASGEAFEHRLVDGMYWLQNPVSIPPSWVGYDLEAFSELAQGDPSAAVDGDVYLLTVGASVTSITEVAVFDDGSEVWTVKVSADELLPLVVTARVRQRLANAGLQPTDLESTALLAVDPDGMVVGLIAELDEWWQAVVDQTIESSEAPAGMVLQFQIGDFDAVVEVETPCSDPEELLEPEAPPALVCES